MDLLCIPLEDITLPGALVALSGLPDLTLLDSALPDPHLGRYAFLMADPFQRLSWAGGRLLLDGVERQEDPWAALRRLLDQYPMAPDAQAPPFRGGAAGYVGYDMGYALHHLDPPPSDEWAMPGMMVHFYDLVLVFDQLAGRAWLYSSGYPEQDTDRRRARAQSRAAEWQALLAPPISMPPPECPVPKEEWTSNFSPEGYGEAVRQVREYIAAGDFFQANIAQRFTATRPEGFDPLAFYLRLRTANAAPFAAYLHYGDWQVASASPERFIQVREGRVETRPIKGTRPRAAAPAADQALADALLNSAKDRAENTMIVDLLRNDLSRVCIPGSVQVPVHCGLESYASVHHLVSVVEGQLAEGYSGLDALRAGFPGGSITGAPKKRSMEIIAELETLPRHLYCGSIGYWGFDGNMDTNIAIRTVLMGPASLSFQSGGGITWLSDPEEEYAETMTKAARIFKSFEV